MPSEEPPSDASCNSGSLDSSSLEEVLDRYLDELAEGRNPDQDSYLRAHPELADALRGVFKTLDFVEATSKSLDTSQLQRGRQLGEYRILREVARGGMGVVYEAVQTSLGRRVALKVLPTGALLSENAAERFAREAAMAGRLHHTNIVPVYGVGQEKGIHFYAMQFIEGRSLSQHLKELRRTGTTVGQDYFRRVAHWGQQVADALTCAHAQGIIHRDIKPSNLLLDARDNVWVTDFGLARGDALATITVSGDVIGTARYMSPEQARGGRTQLDARTDIYSLGTTLYELLTLSPAYDGESRETVLNRIAFADPQPLRQVNRVIPKDLETIVGKCMEKEPARRYASAADLAEDCRRFAAGESIRARRTPLVVKAARYIRRHRVHAAGILLAAILAAMSGTLLVRDRQLRGRQQLDEVRATILIDHDFPRATELLDELEARGFDSANLHFYRGLIPILSTQPQRAHEHLVRALQRDPDHLEACLGMACANLLTGDLVNGQRLFDRACEQPIETALGWLLHGLILVQMQTGDPLDSYERALTCQSDFTPAIEARAEFRARDLLVAGNRDQLQPMLDDYDAWVIFRPNSARARSARGSGWTYAAAYAASQPDLASSAPQWLAQARADLERGIELGRPDEIGPLGRYGSHLRYAGDLKTSADVFVKAVAIDRANAGDNHPGLLHHLALAWHGLGRIEEAQECIEQAPEAQEAFFPLYLQRALLLAECGRLEEGRAICRAGLEEQRADTMRFYLSAAMMSLLGEHDTTQSAVKALLVEDGPMANSAVARYLAGQMTAADFLAAAGTNPGAVCDHAFFVAACEYGQGHRQTGEAALQRCLEGHVYIYLEYRFAQIIRLRLDADPAWPSWIPPSR